MARDFWSKGLVSRDLRSSSRCSRVLRRPPQSPAVLETSLTTSAVSRDTFSDQAAGAGSLKPRVGGGGRVTDGQRFWMSNTQRSKSFTASMTVLPTKHLFGHNGTMMPRANSRRREAGRLFILPVTIHGPYLHTGIPAYRPHRAVAGAEARRQ